MLTGGTDELGQVVRESEIVPNLRGWRATIEVMNGTVIERDGGRGYLACTPASHPYRIGSFGATEADAVRGLREAITRWDAIMEIEGEQDADSTSD
jgi:hypothetical protein